MRVVLTQSEGRLEGLDALLLARGFEVIRHPLIQTRTIEGASLVSLDDCPWWLFTSVAAVEAVVHLGGSLKGHKLGAVGETTAAAIQAGGGKVSLTAPEANAASLAEAFIAYGEAGPVGWPKGELALPILAEALASTGYLVKSLNVYRSETIPWPAGLPAPDITVFASPSAVDALPDAIAHKTYCLAIGSTTAQRLQARGLRHSVAPSPSVEGILGAIEQIKASQLSTSPR